MNTASTTDSSPLDNARFWDLYGKFIKGDFKDGALNTLLYHLIKRHLKEILTLEYPGTAFKATAARIALIACEISVGDSSPLEITPGDVLIYKRASCSLLVVTVMPTLELEHSFAVDEMFDGGAFLPLFRQDHIEHALDTYLAGVRKELMEISRYGMASQN